MTRIWRPDDDPTPPQPIWRWMWSRWVRRRGPVPVAVGAVRQKQSSPPLGGRPAAVVSLPRLPRPEIGRGGRSVGWSSLSKATPTEPASVQLRGAQSLSQPQKLVAEDRGVNWPEGRL